MIIIMIMLIGKYFTQNSVTNMFSTLDYQANRMTA